MEKKDMVAIALALVLAPLAVVLLLAFGALSLPFVFIIAAISAVAAGIFAVVEFLYIIYAIIRNSTGNEGEATRKGRNGDYTMEQTKEAK